MASQESTVRPDRERPWHREPMVWLIITLPLSAVIAGLSTVVIAHHGSDPVVADEFRREGLAVLHDPTRDQAAMRLGVSADLDIADSRLIVRLESGRAARPGHVVVVLSHATRAQFDRLITLALLPDGRYGAPLPALAAGHWHLELSPADRAWRLTGEFIDSPHALHLMARPTS